MQRTNKLLKTTSAILLMDKSGAFDKLWKNKHIVLNLIVSIAILGGLLYLTGFEEFLKEIENLNWIYILISLAFLGVMYLGMALRIKVLLEEMGVKLKYADILFTHFSGMLLADFTPARTGYFGTAYILSKKHKVPGEKALLSILGPQILDFIVKVSAGTFGLFYLLGASGGGSIFIYSGSLVMLLIIAVMVLITFSKRFLGLFSFLEGFPVVSGIYKKIKDMQEHSYVIVDKLPVLIGILIITWISKAISWWAAAKAVGISIDFPIHEVFFFLFFQPLITMLEFIPSPTLAGMGFSEGAGILLLGLVGIPGYKANAFMLVARFKTIIFNIIGLRDLVWLTKKSEKQ